MEVEIQVETEVETEVEIEVEIVEMEVETEVETEVEIVEVEVEVETEVEIVEIVEVEVVVMLTKSAYSVIGPTIFIVNVDEGPEQQPVPEHVNPLKVHPIFTTAFSVTGAFALYHPLPGSTEPEATDSIIVGEIAETAI